MKRLRKAAAAILSVLLGTGCLLTPMHPAAAPATTETGISAVESTETILNPGMGYTSTLWYRCAPGKTAVENPSGALVLMFIDIGAFSSGENGTTDSDGNYTPGKDYDLDDTFFAALRGTFENCRKNGCTIAVRFRYDDNGTQNPEPASFDMLKHHIQQIADSKLLNDYQDILMYVESGFVGCYGEQWGGKYCSLEQKAELLDLLLDVVPDPVPVTVRTPNIFAKWAGIEQKALADWESAPGSRAARVGLFDDGYMGSDSDLGTYTDRAAETGWLGRQATTSYFGGEFSGNLEFAQKYDTYLPENAIPEMYKTHLSYINSNIFGLYENYTFGKDYDVPGVDNSAYYGQTVRKFIRDHLGYRFVIRKASMTKTATQGSDLQLAFSVENTGFANPVRAQKAELLLEKDGNYIRTPVELDSRQWRSCTVTDEQISVQLPGGLAPGNWKAYLKLSVGDNTTEQTHLRSVRFANDGIWNTALGANYIGTVSITETDNPALLTQTNFGTGDGTVYTVNGLRITDGAVSHAGEYGTPAAESGSGKLYLHNDEQYLYITATYNPTAESEVHNFSLYNGEERYEIYYTSGGFVYFNHDEYTGCLQKHSPGIVEFRVPFGPVMNLEPGVKLTKIRYFLQDEANDWAVCSDVTADSYELKADFPVYTAKQTVTLNAGETLLLSVEDGASGQAKYQWYHDGKAISGAVQSSWQLSCADSGAAGLYTVEITSAAGTVRTAEICEVLNVLPHDSSGDINRDGSFNRTDAELLRDYLLTKQTALPVRSAADPDINGRLDARDLTLLKRQLQLTKK
ncbi:MAG: DUF4832 domain-containing protein [Oscillospiraceae bacterium]|nr:DUF4832 domain-containing protein [Oscillospiraceae bacterium]